MTPHDVASVAAGALILAGFGKLALFVAWLAVHWPPHVEVRREGWAVVVRFHPRRAGP